MSHKRPVTEFELIRDVFGDTATIGRLKTPDGKPLAHTLEDCVRGYGIKIQDKTAIPETGEDFNYYLRIRKSLKYGEVPVIYTDFYGGDEYVLNYGGVSFKYILMHGGNNEEHTSGCILVAANRYTDSMEIQGTLKREVTEKVKWYLENGFDTRLKIINKPNG